MEDAAGRLGSSALEWLRGAATRAFLHIGVGGEVRVRVGNDAEVASVHQRHLGVAGTTDVITFDLTDPTVAGPAPFVDADLLVCFDEAERQAGARGIPVERELLLYIVHGVLHCLGHDDHDAAEAARMHAREDEILAAIGVGATFAGVNGTGA